MTEQLKYTLNKYPKISVIMISLNRVDTIKKAIESLVSQNYPNLEFILLDAGSTDGTLDVINGYKQYISYMRSHVDAGPAAAWNEGVDVSTGDIICFLNSDDFYEPQTLIKVGDCVIESPEIEMINVLGRVVKLQSDGSFSVEDITTKEDMPISMGHVKVLYPNCRFFKRGVFKKYGKFISEIDGKATIACDYEFITRLSLHNIKNITLNHMGYNYLAHENSISFNNNKYTKLQIYNEKVFYVEGFFKNYTNLMDAYTSYHLRKEYRKALARRVIKNLIDGEIRLGCKNLSKGVGEFGLGFIVRVLRFYFSYKFRLNKIYRVYFKNNKKVEQYA